MNLIQKGMTINKQYKCKFVYLEESIKVLRFICKIYLFKAPIAKKITIQNRNCTILKILLLQSHKITSQVPRET